MTTAVSTSTAPSFFKHCVEDLAPEKVSSAEWNSKLWEIAAAATFVAFTALAVGSFVAAYFLAPVYVPFVVVGALVLALPTIGITKNFVDYAKGSREEAAKYSCIQRHFDALAQKSNDERQVDLLDRGITWFNIPGIQIARPERLAVLNPLLAHANYWEETMKKHLETKNRLTEDARQLAATDFAKNRKEIYDLRHSALFAEDRALEAKIRAAFANAVLRKVDLANHTDFNGQLEDVVTLSGIGYNERLLGDALSEDTGLTHFLTFKNAQQAPITNQEMKTLSVTQLGQRLVAAM